MAFEQTAQGLACDFDREGHGLRRPDRGRLLNLLLYEIAGAMAGPRF